jgi:hypothetical protein
MALEDAAAVWLRLQPEGHSVWPSDWSYLGPVATRAALS